MNVSTLERAHLPPVGLGLSSVILSAIGTMLFIVPVIGIPIAVAGLLLGMLGIAVAALGGEVQLRLCVVGVLMAAGGLIIIAAIARAPSGYFSPRAVFPALQPLENRPFVPPPAAP